MARLTFEEIQEELDMEFFLDRESVPYKLGRGVSGIQLNIKTCPACGDSRWRTYFGVETGKGNCFVCNETFTKPKFLRFQLGTDDWKVVIEEARELLHEQGWRPKREALAAVDYAEVKLPISDPLPLPDGSNLAYLENRGFGPEITRYMALRWCEHGWWHFRNEEGERATQDFSGRIIIPVFDLDGTLVTFQGRDATGRSALKYLFPKQLPGTGRFLFNAQNVLASRHVVMGEGAFDVAAIKLALDEDVELRDVTAIGSFGKHLSYGSPDGNDQLGRFGQLKRRGVETVTIMWDGEEAAFVAALNAAKLLVGIGLKVRIAMLPFKKDPNEVPGDVVRQVFREARPYSSAFDLRSRLRNPYANAA